jgi:hypothetical protein
LRKALSMCDAFRSRHAVDAALILWTERAAAIVCGVGESICENDIAECGRGFGSASPYSGAKLDAIRRRAKIAAASRFDGRSSSPARDGEHGFLDLCHSEMSDLLEFNMRHVRHLIGHHDSVDDRWAVDGESLADRRL